MRHFKAMLCFGLLLLSTTGCFFIDDGPHERGFVECGDVVCQPGTHCDSPTFDICSDGCLSNANCLEEEQCIKEKSSDRHGSCIPSKQPPCCK